MSEDLNKNGFGFEEDEDDDLMAAYLAPSIDMSEDAHVAILAEDVEYGDGSGIDFSKHFFEPQPGNSYLVKLLPMHKYKNLGHIGNAIVYRSLPDPERKGKTFQFTSSGVGRTCPVLQAFFELHKLKNEGDAAAEQKIKKYFKKSNLGCVLVQILSSTKQDEVGMIRLMRYSTAGPNAVIAQALNKKINPTKQMIAKGFEKEDIFDLFGTSVLSIECAEGEVDGIKIRDFTGTDWAPKKRGAIATLESGETHEFSQKDLIFGKNKDGENVVTGIKPEIIPFFKKFISDANNPDYDLYQYFLYKEPGDPRNSEDTDKYLVNVFKKVDEIVPILLNSTLNEIAKYGKTEARKEGDAEKSTDILEDSIPDELKGSGVVNTKKETAKKPKDDSKPAADESGDDDDLVKAALGN